MRRDGGARHAQRHQRARWRSRVATAGQLITAARDRDVLRRAAARRLGRRLRPAAAARLLAALVRACGTSLCALMPSFAALLPVRVLTMLGAGDLHAAGGRLRRPAGAARAARPRHHLHLPRLVGGLGARPADRRADRRHTSAGAPPSRRSPSCSLVSAAWVWRTLPDGIRPAALSLRGLGPRAPSPVLMASCRHRASGAGQFMLFSYFAPVLKQTLGADADRS